MIAYGPAENLLRPKLLSEARTALAAQKPVIDGSGCLQRSGDPFITGENFLHFASAITELVGGVHAPATGELTAEIFNPFANVSKVRIVSSDSTHDGGKNYAIITIHPRNRTDMVHKFTFGLSTDPLIVHSAHRAKETDTLYDDAKASKLPELLMSESNVGVMLDRILTAYEEQTAPIPAEKTVYAPSEWIEPATKKVLVAAQRYAS